jgi:Transposase
MSESPKFVGIHVAQVELEVALRLGAESWVVSNDESGVATLVACLQALRPVLIVLEATGGLEVLVTSALAAAELLVAAVNPRQARDLAKASASCGAVAPRCAACCIWAPWSLCVIIRSLKPSTSGCAAWGRRPRLPRPHACASC